MPKQQRAPIYHFISAFLILGTLFTLFILSKGILEWPATNVVSEYIILIGIFFFSLLPIILYILKTLIKSGASINFGDFQLDFSRSLSNDTQGIAIAPNFSDSGNRIDASNIESILDSLKRAVDCGIIIINIEEQNPWWETRLLVLLASAVRRGRPGKIVFTRPKNRMKNHFLGWGHPEELLKKLLEKNRDYKVNYYRALAAVNQWYLYRAYNSSELPEDKSKQMEWMGHGVAENFRTRVFDEKYGFPQEFAAEQILAFTLAVEFENQPVKLTVDYLKELFLYIDKPVLMTEHIEQSWDLNRQTKTFFTNDSSYIALTKDGKYVALVPRLSMLNEYVKSLVLPENG